MARVPPPGARRGRKPTAQAALFVNAGARAALSRALGRARGAGVAPSPRDGVNVPTPQDRRARVAVVVVREVDVTDPGSVKW